VKGKTCVSITGKRKKPDPGQTKTALGNVSSGRVGVGVKGEVKKTGFGKKSRGKSAFVFGQKKKGLVGGGGTRPGIGFLD